LLVKTYHFASARSPHREGAERNRPLCAGKRRENVINPVPIIGYNEVVAPLAFSVAPPF
jgi:hypothetical protein